MSSIRTVLRPAASAASRRLLSTTSKATSAPLAVASDAHELQQLHEDLAASLSTGERAWCDVYGVDYAKLLKEAHDESPIALNTPPPRTPAEVHMQNQQQQDIWSVVFGTHK